MKINNKIYSWLGGIALCLILFIGAVSCADEMIQGPNSSELGSKVYSNISVPIGIPLAEDRTRSVDFSDESEMRIDSYWLGIYDTKTGELLGGRMEDKPRKADNTRYTVKTNTPFTAENIDIYYYESNPEVYIVGVINYQNITAHKRSTGEEGTLKEFLEKATTFDYLQDVSVNTSSVDIANPAEKSGNSPIPLMMGYYTPTNVNLHTMVLPQGGLYNDEIRLRLSDGSNGLTLPAGNIRLHRLMAEMNVNITAGEGVTLKNLRYSLVNNPTEVYLEEHIIGSLEIASSTKEEDYLAHTANIADFIEDGYSNNHPYQRSIQQTGPNTWNFSYQGYENKHWGRHYTDNKNRGEHSRRENMWDPNVEPENGVFKALCPDINKTFNNNASYFILTAEVEVVTVQDGKPQKDKALVNYIIHEGYCCSLDGHAAGNGDDFQRIRNVKYTYNITITGLQELLINVQSSGASHDDGLKGQIESVSIVEVESRWPNSEKFMLTEDDCKNLQWRYWERDEDGNEVNYGFWNGSDIPGPEFSGNLSQEIPEELDGLKDIIGFSREQYSSIGYPDCMSLEEFIKEVEENPTGGIFYIYFANFDATDFNNLTARRGFYIGSSYSIQDHDGCSYSTGVYGFEQNIGDNRRVVDLDIRPEYKSYYDIFNTEDHSNPYGYSDANNEYVYNFTPYFSRNYNIQYDYSKNECYWSGTKNTSAYLRFFDYGGYRDKFKIEIYDERDENVELTLYATYEEHCIYNGHDAAFLVPIEGNDLQKLSVGYHTVKFTAAGDPSQYIPGESSYLYHSLHIIDKADWDFTSPMMGKNGQSSGTSIISYFNNNLIVTNNNTSSAYRVLNYGGLTIVGGRAFYASSSYIQTGRGGFPLKTELNNKGGFFKFTLKKNGTLRVYAYHTGAGGSVPIRKIYLYKPKFVGYDGEKFSDWTWTGSGINPQEWIVVDSKEVNNSFNNFNTPTELSVNNITDVTDFYICTDENIYIQRIEFIPD